MISCELSSETCWSERRAFARREIMLLLEQRDRPLRILNLLAQIGEMAVQPLACPRRRFVFHVELIGEIGIDISVRDISREPGIF